MELLKSYLVKLTKKRKYLHFGIPQHWAERYLDDGDELELYQEGDTLILKAKKREEAPCK